MNARTRTYTAYRIGVGIAGAILLVVASLLAPAGKRKNVFLVFCGFGIGWVSATIARYVYPPRRSTGRISVRGPDLPESGDREHTILYAASGRDCICARPFRQRKGWLTPHQLHWRIG